MVKAGRGGPGLGVPHPEERIVLLQGPQCLPVRILSQTWHGALASCLACDLPTRGHCLTPLPDPEPKQAWPHILNMEPSRLWVFHKALSFWDCVAATENNKHPLLDLHHVSGRQMRPLRMAGPDSGHAVQLICAGFTGCPREPGRGRPRTAVGRTWAAPWSG